MGTCLALCTSLQIQTTDSNIKLISDKVTNFDLVCCVSSCPSQTSVRNEEPFIIPSWISALLPHLILIRVHPKTTLLSDEETKQSPFGPFAEEPGLRGLRGGLGGMRASAAGSSAANRRRAGPAPGFATPRQKGPEPGLSELRFLYRGREGSPGRSEVCGRESVMTSHPLPPLASSASWTSSDAGLSPD